MQHACLDIVQCRKMYDRSEYIYYHIRCYRVGGWWFVIYGSHWIFYCLQSWPQEQKRNSELPPGSDTQDYTVSMTPLCHVSCFLDSGFDFGCSGCTSSFIMVTHCEARWHIRLCEVGHYCSGNGLGSVLCQAINLNNAELSLIEYPWTEFHAN